MPAADLVVTPPPADLPAAPPLPRAVVRGALLIAVGLPLLLLAALVFLMIAANYNILTWME